MNMNQFIHSKLYPEKCWHEQGKSTKSNPNGDYQCVKCKKRILEWFAYPESVSNPDYFTDEWIPKLIARLVELGWWRKFEDYYGRIYMEPIVSVEWLIPWLCQQPRFTTLLVDYLQKGEKG